MTCDEATQSEWTCGMYPHEMLHLNLKRKISQFCEKNEIEFFIDPDTQEYLFKSQYSRDRVTKMLKEEFIREFNLS